MSPSFTWLWLLTPSLARGSARTERAPLELALDPPAIPACSTFWMTPQLSRSVSVCFFEFPVGYGVTSGLREILSEEAVDLIQFGAEASYIVQFD
jgi:hypothetical protein